MNKKDSNINLGSALIKDMLKLILNNEKFCILNLLKKYFSLDKIFIYLIAEKLSLTNSKEPPARFVCALCVADPDGTIVAETEGTFDGVITSSPKGINGFGYDPLLFLPDVGMTSAELSPEAKNARSHRGVAAKKMLTLIELSE